MEIDEAIEKIDKNHCKEVCSDNCMYGRNFCEYRMAIDALKFQQEYQAKVQKCIERLKNYKRKEYDERDESYNFGLDEAIEIIKEEMGVEE